MGSVRAPGSAWHEAATHTCSLVHMAWLAVALQGQFSSLLWMGSVWGCLIWGLTSGTEEFGPFLSPCQEQDCGRGGL